MWSVADIIRAGVLVREAEAYLRGFSDRQDELIMELYGEMDNGYVA